MAACIEQEQQQQQQQHAVFKHYCRVCKKGFMCGRALGGHMRAHGIGDESANMEEEEEEEDDPVSDWEEKVTTSNKRMYKLRTNPNRLKSVRVCENCGQEFFSWKSFLEHGKCGSGDDAEAESLVSSPGSDADESFGRRGHGWSKRKRSLRTKVGSYGGSPAGYLSSEDEDLLFAKCLVDLANARVYSLAAEPEESSCASASKEEERRNTAAGEFLAPLATPRVGLSHNKANNKTASSKGLFECKACKKVFTSHQALGGHRASHKKVKGCYAAKQDLQDADSLADEDVITHEEFLPNSKSSSSYQFEHGGSAYPGGASRRKSKVHECSICHRVFTTGQALGGHKRCHWITSNTTYSPAETSIAKFHFHDHQHTKKPEAAALDLNLPAGGGSGDDMSRHRNPSLNRLSLEVSTEIHLHRPWYMDTETDKDDNNNPTKKDNNDNNVAIATQNVAEDDEADSRLKYARISGLKETSTSKGNSSSQWLQVGIGSAAAAEVGQD